MSEKYKVRNPGGHYFVTCTIVDWVDLFTRPLYKDIIINSLKYCIEHKGLIVHAYVIMTNHVHLIISARENESIPDIMRDFKTFTSKALLKEIQSAKESRRKWLLNKFKQEANRRKRGQNYKLWQDGFHPIELLSSAMAEQKLQCIHNNPVVERIVDEAVDYIYSSARQYAGEAVELEVVFII